jgi:hypothetical protein
LIRERRPLTDAEWRAITSPCSGRRGVLANPHLLRRHRENGHARRGKGAKVGDER